MGISKGRFAFDIESDGLNRKLTKIHCIVVQDLDTGEVAKFPPEMISLGLRVLSDANELWAHNGISYDIPAIRELHPAFKTKARVFDTLIMSRLFFSDMLDRDFRAKPPNMPGQLYGRHSLEAWGYRLGCYKSEFGKGLDGNWSTYSEEMLDYCVQDVKVLVELERFFEPKIEQYADCLKTEFDCAEVMSQQEYAGFPFNVKKAQLLEDKLRTELMALSDEMRSTFTYVDGGKFTPARDNKRYGYIQGAVCNRLTQFSPTSRDHIAWAFMVHRHWHPIEKTKTGKVKVDEETLGLIGTEEARKFGRILELQKQVGLLSEGKNAWLKLVEADGRIRHACYLNTATGRNVHMRPNLAQVPSGAEFRELFEASPGYRLVSADCSSLELRCLAHYLARYDGGSFGREVVDGDVHQHMANISQVSRRTQKTITYALIYGAGDWRLGLAAGEKEKEAATARGRELRRKLMTGITGFLELSLTVRKKAKTGTIRGLDGRPIRIRASHSALNFLLQGAGAIICKKWVARANALAKEAGLDYFPVEFVHDQQSWCVHDDAESINKATWCMEQAIKDVKDGLNFRVALAVDAKSGTNWAEVH